MLGFWASLVSPDRRQPGAEVGVAQGDPEFGLDQAVRDPLVIVVEAARHRRKPSGFERHDRRRLYPEELGSMSDDRRRWCGVVIADVVDSTGPRPLHRGD